jgi:hypothetical protein
METRNTFFFLQSIHYPSRYRQKFCVRDALKISISILSVSGFFSYQNKKYGQFYCSVNSFNRKIFAVAIPNTKTATLINAIKEMLKVK